MQNTVSNNSKNCLFIGDLSIFCTEDDVRSIFARFGELIEIKIMRSEDKGRSLSYGFVKFADPSCAARAINELQNCMLNGRKLRVAWASYKTKGSSAMPSHPDVETSAVHVSFISYQVKNLVTEASLRNLFSRYGEVADVSIKKSSVDKNVNRQSGYGFVHFRINSAGIEAAIRAAQELQDTTVDEVNYKSSLSHKLTEFIEESASVTPTKVEAPYPAPVSASHAVSNVQVNTHVSTSPTPVYSAPLPPAPLPPAPVVRPTYPMPQQPGPYPIPNGSIIMQSPNISAYPPMMAPYSVPTHPGMRLPNGTDPTYGMNPVLAVPSPYMGQHSPQMDYRFPAPYPPSVVPQPPYPPVYAAMGSPNPPASPQFYVGDPLYCITPSSISSIDTAYHEMIGNLLLSPSEVPRPGDQFNYNKRSSPLTNGRPQTGHASRITNSGNTSSTVNLKKVRDRSLRSHFNDFESKELDKSGNPGSVPRANPASSQAQNHSAVPDQHR